MLAQLDFNRIQAIGAPTFAFWGRGGGDLGSVISAILPYIFGAAGIALLIYLVMGGLQMMTSRGDPKAMQGAQAKITNALIGFVIVITAFLIVQILAQIFKSTGTGGFGEPFNK